MEKTMLIVDDNEINQGLLTSIFEDEFTIMTADDGRAALTKLNYFGEKISIVLLDLMMPGMDGFEVLKKIRETPKLGSIPVIVVSSKSADEDGLEAIRCGASDFVTKPVNAELIKIRVDAAISRSENSRLQAENDYYLLQSGKEAKYQTVLESTGTVVVEFDLLDNGYKYDPSISKHIAGNFDDRRLERILVSDMVADVADVRTMQSLIYSLSADGSKDSGSMLLKLKTPSGARQWFRMQAFAQRSETERSGRVILTFNNVHDEVVNSEKLRFQAERDELTGLYNRATFFEKASEMIDAHEAGFYIMTSFDINRFKVLNDQYGTDKGDEVLKFVADTFRSSFVPAGGLVGRIMADHFAVLYPASLADSRLLAEIRSATSALDGSIPPISFSIGRYLVNDLSLPASAMYDRAALADASVKGRYDTHIAQYDESMRDSLIREQEIVNDMELALETGQFEVWLQPQYNHATKALIGAEALVRWRRPGRGVVPPNEFIPVFERNGFVYELDKYVWEQTCALLRRWIDEGHEPLPVSVNISRNDLYHDDMPDNILGYVEKYRIPIDMLRLEITESAFANSTNRVVRAVKSLIDAGFTVEIDDFGSGYSSLNTLKDVPAHILKLDMRFLESSDDSDRGGNVLESIVRMAKWLGMAVIAEGVETIEQADYLKSIGCVYIQGYLYAKPMPSDEYEALAKSEDREEKLLTLEAVKNLDNNAFWDPKSMDTLIFNSFVGAACIVEYREGYVEMVRVSDMFMQMLGSGSLTVDDVLKLDWKNYCAEESRAELLASVRKSIETSESVTGEYLFLNLPGCPEKAYFRVTLRVIASSGDSYLIYCLSENTTVQKELEEKERASAEQLQAIMDNINGGVNVSVIRDGVPKVQFANERYYKMRGYTKEQYDEEVTHLDKIIHPEDREMMYKATSTATDPFSLIYRIVRRNGEVRWIINNVTFVTLPEFDEPVQLSVTNDITEMRETEEKERAIAAQLQAIMDNINGGVNMSVLRDGAPLIKFANEQFYSLMGYTKEQFEAEVPDPRTIVHSEDRDKVFSAVAALDKSDSLVYRIIRRDGAVRWLQNNITIVRLPEFDEPVQLSVTNDITELREAERKEHEISERMQTILGALNSGVSGVTLRDGELRYVFANDMYYEMLGYTREQFEAEVGNGMKLIHPDDRERVDSELAKLSRTGGSMIFEYRVIKRDGETAHLRVNASMVSLDGVDGPVSLGVATDVTDMVMARQQISGLSERLQAVLDNIHNGISVSEIDGLKVEYLFCNNRYFELHGYTKEQYEAEVPVVSELIHPDDRQRVIDATADVNEIGKHAALEYRIIRRDGAVRWLRATISVRSMTSLPRPIQFTVYSDITDERVAQEKLLATNEQLQTIMNDMPGGFARLRVMSDGDISTVYVNDYFCRMRGMTREKVLSAGRQDAMGSVHPDDLEMVRKTVMDIVSTGETRNIVYRLEHADGSYVPYSVFGRVTTGDDGAKYINAYYASLSEREKKEQTVRETIPIILSAILASSTNLAFAKDKDFRYICASADFLSMTSFSRESDVIGKTDYDIFPKESADQFRREDMSVLETNTPLLDYVEAVPLPDGGMRYNKLSKYLLSDTFGNALGVYGVGRNITEDKDAYSRLKLLVDSIPGGIASYIASPDGVKLTYFNDGFCGMFGYTREEYEAVAATGVANLAYPEDAPKIVEKLSALIREDKPLDSTHRVNTKGGGYKWVNLRGSVAERHGEVCLINAVLYDVTERMEVENILRMDEEQFRIAADIAGRSVARYDIKTGVYHHRSKFLLDKGFDNRVENAPQAFINEGIIAPEFVGEYLEYYEKLRRGDSPCSIDFAVKGEDGAWRWLREDATVLPDADGNPSKAIIVFSDITELREKEAIYRKWQQSLEQRSEDAYMLFRCNLSKNSSFDSAEGKLLWVEFDAGAYSFDDRTQEYMKKCVYEEDLAEYWAFMNSDTLLANYYRGVRTKAMEYREVMPDGTMRWLRLTVELVQYPNSADVEAFLLYEDIDAAKRGELHTRQLAETDPLTGILNRTAFSQAVDRIIDEHSAAGGLAVLMLDIDAFKRVNDTLGHDMGDRVLKDTADTLRSVLRQGDLVGRLGGDEFLICLRDIYDDDAIKRKAQQICSLLHKSLNLELATSTSVGIAVCPRDGRDFETLYKKADKALYKVKAQGKNNYAFYDESMARKRAKSGDAKSEKGKDK